jgi:4'-phosphopantetheinyl transferase
MVELAASEVHVWFGAEASGADGRTLSAGERRRAARLPEGVIRSRYVFAHGALRRVLSRYLGETDGEIALAATPAGKPLLADRPERLRFNLSHTAGLVAVAVSRSRDVGVDVERIRHLPDAGPIAARWFPAGVRALVEASPPEDRDRTFFACWTRLEARVKAAGTGIVDLPHPDTRWWIADLEAPAGYAAAVAVEGGPATIRCFTLQKL